MLHVAEAFIDKNYHPTVICRGTVSSPCGFFLFLFVHYRFFFMIYPTFICLAAYNKALEDALAVLEKIAMPIDVNDRKCLGSICTFRYWLRDFPNSISLFHFIGRKFSAYINGK